jgi:NAD(P)-dependent dehydrogenase (short-subunit alcohol dehydrogenase family)
MEESQSHGPRIGRSGLHVTGGSRGRLVRAEEIAAVIVFLCSERASNVAGAAWSVDGGAVGVII